MSKFNKYEKSLTEAERAFVDDVDSIKDLRNAPDIWLKHIETVRMASIKDREDMVECLCQPFFFRSDATREFLVPWLRECIVYRAKMNKLKR